MTSSASTPRVRLILAWYLAVLILVAVSERDSFGSLGGQLIGLFGLALMIVAALGRIWASAHIAGCKDATLVTTGPYSLCRNPLYAFSIVGGLGVGLATRSPAIAIATSGLLVVLHLRAIASEERTLRAAHGEAFERYCARVPRLLPSWKNCEDAASVRIVPAVLRKAFLDAGSFLLVYVIVALLDALREANWLPTLLRL